MSHPSGALGFIRIDLIIRLPVRRFLRIRIQSRSRFLNDEDGGRGGLFDSFDVDRLGSFSKILTQGLDPCEGVRSLRRSPGKAS